MSKLTPFKWNYANLMAMDIPLSGSNDAIAPLIRLFTHGPKYMFDASKPNHALLLTEIEQQIIGMEMAKGGIRPCSLEEYNTSKNQVASVYRWKDYLNEFNIANGTLQKKRELLLFLFREGLGGKLEE